MANMQTSRAEMNENNFEWFQLLGRLGVSAVGYPFEYVKVLIQVNRFTKTWISFLKFMLIFIETDNFSYKIQLRLILKLHCKSVLSEFNFVFNFISTGFGSISCFLLKLLKKLWFWLGFTYSVSYWMYLFPFWARITN